MDFFELTPFRGVRLRIGDGQWKCPEAATFFKNARPAP